MKHLFSHHDQVGLVFNFSELVNTAYQNQKNALCWYRELTGNFQEIVEHFITDENIIEISSEELLALSLTKNGEIARQHILNDLTFLSDYGASPTLNLIKNYDRDDELDFISTDVYSYHVDRSPIPTDTFLCTYYGASSDIIANDQVQQKIMIPEIRAQLKTLYDGHEDQFEDFLAEYFFDLHYQAKPNATPLNLGQGHLWRLAVDHPEQQVLPCVHRAPHENGDYRLLLIC